MRRTIEHFKVELSHALYVTIIINKYISEAKVLKLSDDAESGGKPVVNGNGGTTESVRCETCSAVFDNLVQFMDHRNFECEAGNILFFSTNIHCMLTD